MLPSEAVAIARAEGVRLERLAGTVDLQWIALTEAERAAAAGTPSLLAKHGVLLAVGAPVWFGWASGLLSAGALAAFALSRTVGLFGFVETGWEPVPYALLSVVAEAVAVLTAGVWAVRAARGR